MCPFFFERFNQEPCIVPFLCFVNSLVDENVEGDEDEDWHELSGDEGVDAVEDRVVPVGEASLN